MALFLQHREPSFQWGIWKMEEPIDVLLGLLPERAYYEEELQRFISSKSPANVSASPDTLSKSSSSSFVIL